MALALQYVECPRCGGMMPDPASSTASAWVEWNRQRVCEKCANDCHARRAELLGVVIAPDALRVHE